MASRSVSEPIHSGHFMTSNPHSDELLPDEEVVEVVATDGVIVEMEDDEQKEDLHDLNAPDEKPVTFYKFGPKKTQSIAIDVSLNKLNKCIKVAYNKMRTPKWKDFRGLRLHWKQRIRLNNVIWRAYYMEFRRPDRDRKKTPYCYFSVPDSDTTPRRHEGTILEGMYWKRGLEALKSQYKRWRRHFKTRPRGRRRGASCGFDNYHLHRPLANHTPKTGSAEAFDLDDLNNEFTDSLFANLMQPYTFPNPKEIATGCIADVMQPGLLSLQPSIEEIMASFGNYYDTPDSMPQNAVATKSSMSPADEVAISNAVPDTSSTPSTYELELKELEPSFASYGCGGIQQPTRQSSSILPQMLLANSSAPTYSQAACEQTPLVIASLPYSDASFDYIPQFLMGCPSRPSSSFSLPSSNLLSNRNFCWSNLSPVSCTTAMSENRPNSSAAVCLGSNQSTPAPSVLTSLGLVPETVSPATQSAFTFSRLEMTPRTSLQQLSERYHSVHSSSSPMSHSPSSIPDAFHSPLSVQFHSPATPSVGSQMSLSSPYGPVTHLPITKVNSAIPAEMLMNEASSPAMPSCFQPGTSPASSPSPGTPLTPRSTGKSNFNSSAGASPQQVEPLRRRRRATNVVNEVEKRKRMADNGQVWQRMIPEYPQQSTNPKSITVTSKLERKQVKVERPKSVLTISSPESSCSTSRSSTGRGAAADSSSNIIESEERKRMLHISAEQYRRSALREGFELLARYLPEAHSGVKLTNARILALSVERLKNLKKQKIEKDNMERLLKVELNHMKNTVSKYQMSMSPMPTMDQPTFMLQMQYFLNAHIRQRALSDVNFGLCYMLIKPLVESLMFLLTNIPLGNKDAVMTTCNNWSHEHITCLSFRPLATTFILNMATQMRTRTYPEGLREIVQIEMDNIEKKGLNASTQR